MSLDWNDLKPKFGKRETFEELCCQLSSREKYPDGSFFTRNAPPDGGVECYWTLPDGTQNAWQAKFFTNQWSTSQWQQIDKSVKSAIDNFRGLKKYTICVPKDRTDSTIKRQWNIHEKKWKSLAARKKMKVKFDYWGSSEILSKVLEPKNTGIAKYFFDKDFFNQNWFENHISEVIAHASSRYTEKLNIKLPISKSFEILCRSEKFINYFRKILKEINDNFNQCHSKETNKILEKEFEILKPQIEKIIDFIKKLQFSEQNIIDWGILSKLIEYVHPTLLKCNTILTEQARENNAKEKPGSYSPYLQDFHSERYHLSTLYETLENVRRFAVGEYGTITNVKTLLVSGYAGTGKTHLFCDVAKNRIKEKLPTVVLFGARFVKGDPLDQILKHLRLNCTVDDFLGALESSAQVAGSRALIMIDALNEGDGKIIWPEYLAQMIQMLSRHPWIALALSVRSTYERIIGVEELISKKLIKITHSGFGRYTYQASKIFFENNGIESPSIPVLVPEFSNPQFLTILVNSLKKRNLTKIPPGIDGYNSGFEFFMDSIDLVLSKATRLGLPIDKKIVKITAIKIAEAMAYEKTRYLKYNKAEQIAESIFYSGPEDEKLLLSNLISEGLFSVEHREINQIEEKVIQFAFERFGDSMIAEFLLDIEITKSHPRRDFRKSKIFSEIFKDEISMFHNGGLIDAITIHLAERYNCELIELSPKFRTSSKILESFIESLQWRSSGSIKKSTTKLLDNIMQKNPKFNRLFLKTLLSISTNSKNLFNGDYLHNYLISKSLPERDFIWSIFLHREYYSDDSIIQRYIDWIWFSNGKKNLDHHGIILAGKTLCWFLTSSNRFIRDKATKSLVSLFTHEINSLRQILWTFHSVNDPYVIERIYAVAYGCALRTTDMQSLKNLATDVYDQIFKTSPPPDILLRDYARGVIEVAKYRGIKLSFNLSKVNPPYRSKWFNRIPSDKTIEVLLKNAKNVDGYIERSVYSSVMSDDFGIYVIGSNSDWSKMKLIGSSRKSRQTLLREFSDSIKPAQNIVWENCIYVKTKKETLSRYKNETLNKIFRHDFGDRKFDDIYSEIDKFYESALVSVLDKSQLLLYKRYVKPYLEFKSARREIAFSNLEMKKLIVKKVYELGWNSDIFGVFDKEVGRFRDSQYYDYRTSRKPERIGKKYQWIAYQEVLARLSDNFELRSDFGTLPFRPYEGSWQISYLRDIDPSFLLNKTREKDDWGHQNPTWWFPFRYDSWGEGKDDAQWLRNKKDLPPLTQLLEVTNPENQSKWFVLHASYHLERKMSLDEEKYHIPRREIWLHLRSYLVKKSKMKKMFDWAKKQHYQGIRLPENHDYSSQTYMGEYYWAESAISESPNDEIWIDKVHHENPLPVEVAKTSLRYSHETGYDCSVDENIRIQIPSKLVYDNINPEITRDGIIYDSNKEIIAFDPSVIIEGPSALLVKHETFLEFLKKHDYDILWNIIGERRLIGGDLKVWKGGQELYGVYRLHNKKPTGITKQLFVSKAMIDKRNSKRQSKIDKRVKTSKRRKNS